MEQYGGVGLVDRISILPLQIEHFGVTEVVLCTILAGILPAVIDADGNDDRHETDKEPVYHFLIHPLVQRSAHDTSADPAGRHQEQGRPLEGRDCAGRYGSQHAGQLAEQDDIQTVGCCGLGVHVEEVKQHHQIDGTAADTQKTGHEIGRAHV